MAKKIGIIGSGVVGVTLANGFVKHGYDVLIGTNTPAKRDDLKTKTHGRAHVGSFADAAMFGDVVVLTTKGGAADAAIRTAGIDYLAGKTVIDTTNPIADAPPVNGVLRVLHAAERLTDGTAAAAGAGGELRQGLLMRWKRADGQPDAPGRTADDVHLRKQRTRQGRSLDDPQSVRFRG